MFIKRELFETLLNAFISRHPVGVILPGIVGAGKTTLIHMLSDTLKSHGFDIFIYNGDDSSFRTSVAADSKLVFHDIVSSGTKRPFVFIDEVQKEPVIFDALKIAHDKGKASFIVSGSNPAFLKTHARNRLQRRAEVYTLFPFSLKELLYDKKVINHDLFNSNLFETILNGLISNKTPIVPSIKAINKDELELNNFLIYGGLPKAYLSDTSVTKLNEIRLVAERGITESFRATTSIDDEIRRYLAVHNSMEFAYKGISQTIRSTKRDLVDSVIDHLLNQGYLFKKRPFLHQFENKKTTYLSKYSWADNGLVTYYIGDTKRKEESLGLALEAYVHTRLYSYLEKIPFHSSVFYYKPFRHKKSTDSLEFMKGEIDFVLRVGSVLIPIEVKQTNKIGNIDTTLLNEVIKKWKLKFGIILYGGAPFKDGKLIYWPYWLI